MKGMVGILVLAATLEVSETSMQNSINFTQETVWLNPDKLVLQHRPGPAVRDWYVLTSTNNWMIGGKEHIMDAFVGSVVRLSWSSRLNETYIVQYSTNAGVWWNERVIIHGDGMTRYWYDWPQNRSYRLAQNYAAPQNLSIKY